MEGSGPVRLNRARQGRPEAAHEAALTGPGLRMPPGSNTPRSSPSLSRGSIWARFCIMDFGQKCRSRNATSWPRTSGVLQLGGSYRVAPVEGTSCRVEFSVVFVVGVWLWIRTGSGQAWVMYRCRHRGQGCAQPARTNTGLTRAAVLGMKLLRDDQDLQEAIRRNLAAGSRTEPAKARRRRRTGAGETLGALSDKRRKLLELYYRDGISGDLFSEEESRLCSAIEAARSEASDEQTQNRIQNELEARFEQVASLLQSLDIEAVWIAAEEQERRSWSRNWWRPLGSSLTIWRSL